MQNYELLKTDPTIHNAYLTKKQNSVLFSEILKHTFSGKKEPISFISLNITTGSPETSSKVLSDYIEFTLNQSKIEFVELYRRTIKDILEVNDYRAENLRTEFQEKLLIKSQEVEEALLISTGTKQDSHIAKEVKTMFTGNVPLFLTGKESLRLKLKLLKEKLALSNDKRADSYISGMASISSANNTLNLALSKKIGIKTAIIDAAPNTPTTHSKPKRALIIALSVITGCFIGLLSGLIKSSYKRYRINKHQTTS